MIYLFSCYIKTSENNSASSTLEFCYFFNNSICCFFKCHKRLDCVWKILVSVFCKCNCCHSLLNLFVIDITGKLALICCLRNSSIRTLKHECAQGRSRQVCQTVWSWLVFTAVRAVVTHSLLFLHSKSLSHFSPPCYSHGTLLAFLIVSMKAAFL